MLLPPVAVALLFPFKKYIPAPLTLVLVLAALFNCNSLAAEDPPQTQYLAEIRLHTADEFYSVLRRAEYLLSAGALPVGSKTPVTFILHGPEVRILLRENYLENSGTVNLAARLSALGVVEIKACETWMGGQSIAAEQLQPFVETIRYGPEETRRLVAEQKYLYF